MHLNCKFLSLGCIFHMFSRKLCHKTTCLNISITLVRTYVFCCSSNTLRMCANHMRICWAYSVGMMRGVFLCIHATYMHTCEIHPSEMHPPEMYSFVMHQWIYFYWHNSELITWRLTSTTQIEQIRWYNSYLIKSNQFNELQWKFKTNGFILILIWIQFAEKWRVKS